MDGFILIKPFLPVGGIHYDVAYLTYRMLRRDHFLKTKIFELTENPSYRAMLSRPCHPSDYLSYLIMSVHVGKHSAIEKSMEEKLVELMTDKVMYIGL